MKFYVLTLSSGSRLGTIIPINLSEIINVYGFSPSITTHTMQMQSLKSQSFYLIFFHCILVPSKKKKTFYCNCARYDKSRTFPSHLFLPSVWHNRGNSSPNLPVKLISLSREINRNRSRNPAVTITITITVTVTVTVFL